LSSLPPREAALLLREAVGELSRRMPIEPGDIAPEAGFAKLAKLAARLERGDGAAGGAAAADEEVAALDSWIRLADSFVLHADAGEAEARAELGRRLRAVRTVVAPGGEQLTSDSRDGAERG
jgi:hypothetical protein